MRVTVQNFRCYGPLRTWSFPSGVLSLFTGTSGVGKSTLLNAIYWCLYGGMLRIRPHSADAKAVTLVSVSLQMAEGGSEVTVTRRTPNIVEVELEGIPTPLMQGIRGDAAQAYIDRMFGRKTLWLASSYIGQGGRHPLLTVSNAERLQLLSELTFGHDMELEVNTPEFYLDRIDASLVPTRTCIATETGRFNGCRDLHLQRCTQLEATVRMWPSEQSLDVLPTLTTQRQEVIQARNEMKARLETVRKEEASRDALLDIATGIDAEILAIGPDVDPAPLETALTEAREKHARHTAYVTWERETTRLDTALAALPPTLDLDTLDAQIEATTRFHTTCSRLGQNPLTLEEDREALTTAVETYRSRAERWREYEVARAAWETETASQRAAHLALVTNQREEAERRYETDLRLWKQACFHAEAVQAQAFTAECELARAHHEAEIERWRQEMRDVHSVQDARAEWEAMCQRLQREADATYEREMVVHKERLSSLTQIHADQVAIYQAQLDRQVAYTRLSTHRDRILEELTTVDAECERHRAQLRDMSPGSFEGVSEGNGSAAPIANPTEGEGLEKSAPGSLADMSLSELETDLAALRLSRQELMCPHCQRGIIYDRGTLRPGRLNALDQTQREARIELLERVLATRTALVSLNQQRDTLRTHLGQLVLPAPPTPPRPVQDPVLPTPPVRLPVDLPSLDSRWISPVTTRPEPQLRLPDPKDPMYPPKPRLVLPPPPTCQLTPRPCPPPKPGPDPSSRLAELEVLGPLPPLGVETLEAERKKALHRHTLLEQRSRLPPTMEPVLDADVIGAEAQLEAVRKRRLQREILTRRRPVVPPAVVPSSEDLLSQLNQGQKDLDRLDALIAAGTALTELAAERRTLATLHQNLLALIQHESHLVQLRALVNELAVSSLETTVQAITAHLNVILRDLFEDPLTVTLATHKELKTTDRKKLQVNIQVYYRGSVYDGPGSLSGGEQDRLSLGLTLAVAHLSESPLLLLDECMASLDDTLREKCLLAIRTHAPGKTVLHVCHEAVEGFHDITVSAE